MFGWTEENIAIAKEGMEGGLSARQISMQIGCTRNAVIGKMLRMGIKSTNVKGHQRGTPSPWKKAAPKPPKQRPNKMTINFRSIAKPPEKPKERPSAPPPCTMEFLELRANGCRWPEGDGPFLFCGDPMVEGRSYCPTHCRIAYQPTPGLIRRRDQYEEAA